MKQIVMLPFFLAALIIFPSYGNCDPLEDLMEQFSKEYDAEKPPTPYSSVNSDYKLSQAALGSLYTTKTLGLLYRQNEQLLAKYNAMIEKYDHLIDQNERIIELLSTIARKGDGNKTGDRLINK